jgi:hypothetical protein
MYAQHNNYSMFTLLLPLDFQFVNACSISSYGSIMLCITFDPNDDRLIWGQ